MRPVRALPATLGALAAAGLLSGCVSAMPVDPPSPTGADAFGCASLHGRLPDELDGHTVTPLEPRSPYTAAWGQPAIVLRCGVPVPAALNPASQTIVVNGVEWFPEQLTDGWMFTTVGRRLVVEVSVPSAYSPEADVLVDLGPAISGQDPLTSPSPSAS